MVLCNLLLDITYADVNKHKIMQSLLTPVGPKSVFEADFKKGELKNNNYTEHTFEGC